MYYHFYYCLYNLSVTIKTAVTGKTMVNFCKKFPKIVFIYELIILYIVNV